VPAACLIASLRSGQLRYTGVISVDGQLPRHSVSVAGIVVDDHGRALLIRRLDNRRWVPPGGVLELGETIHDGLRREVREETGLDVEPLALSGVYQNMPHGIIALVFRCKITGGALVTNDEVTDFRWISQSDTPRLMSEAYAIRVLDALHDPGPAAVRPHDGVHLL
jgi:8-oxo-dGTP diphosphatase